MKNKPYKSNDELDLLPFINLIWNGKWIFIIAVVVSILCATIYIKTSSKGFEAKTIVNPISIENRMDYVFFNENELMKVDFVEIQKLYIDQLKIKKNIQEIFIKNELMNRGDFETEDLFQKAVLSEIYKIKIQLKKEEVEKKNVKKDSTEEILLKYEILYSYNDKIKWLNFLDDINNYANKNVRNILVERFESVVKNEIEKKNFDIQDLDLAIQNLFEDYDMFIKNRLVFLKEQTSIARELGIASSTAVGVERMQGLVIGESVIGKTEFTNLKTQNNYYLKGYEAIDKEIQLIEDRTAKEAFMPELLPLEKERRSLKQNQTIERTLATFAKTPLATGINFRAVILDPRSTIFTNYINPVFIYQISVVVGIFFGVLSTYIASIRNKKKKII